MPPPKEGDPRKVLSGEMKLQVQEVPESKEVTLCKLEISD